MLKSKLVLAVAAAICIAASVGAQVRPTTSEAQALLQSRPDLVQQLRQRIIGSGMSADQVRARLKAEGYPENLLDAYLPGAIGVSPTPDNSVLNAARRLGVVDEAGYATMSGALAASTPAPKPVRDEDIGRDQDDADEIFGLSLFRSSSSEFLPTLDGPVDSNYRLGPGDQLVLILTGQVELAHTLDVTREGFIVIPQVGQLSVANLTLAQLEELLYQRLPGSYSGVQRGAEAPTQFTVTVSRLRAIQVYVTGDVLRPSSYRISSAGTAMTALYSAGGPTERGSLREVVVRRAGRTVATLDVYDYLLRGDNSGDTRLENGDVVFVRIHGPRVRVVGEVLRPATYELKPSETLRDALLAAGGFRPTALTERVQIERIVPPGERVPGGRDRTVLDVTSAGPSVETFPTVAMEGGDVVRVFGVTDRVRNRVVVRGNVWSPGTQALTPGLTLSAALASAGGLRPDSYLGEVLISRLRSDNTREQLRARLLDTLGTVVEDVPLREDDEITVFSRTELRPMRSVSIAGPLRNAGQFSWRSGMTLRDLVLLAGGLREESVDASDTAMVDAHPGYVLISRLRPDNTREMLRTDLRDPSGTTIQAFPLSEDDEVRVLLADEFRQEYFVTIGGSVRKPGRYAWRDGMLMRDLVLLAGGLTVGAYLPEAELSRLPTDRSGGVTATTRRVAMDSSYLGDFVAGQPYRGTPGIGAPPAGTAPDVPLEPYDDILIRQQPDFQLQRLVTIAGEVRFPGTYALLKKDETLADLVDRAGGLTAEAAPDGAVFTRTQSDLSFASALNGADGRVRVGIDLPKALRRPRSADNLVLLDRDVLTVPTLRSTVEVRGEVNAPTAATVSAGASLSFYVRAAGGATLKGDSKRAFVVQPNGKIETRWRLLWLIPIDPTPRAGALVVVPEREASTSSSERATLVALIAQTVASVAAVAALLR